MPTDFRRVDSLVDKAMREGLTALGNDVRKRAVVLAPKDTGALRQSARVDLSTSGVDSVTIGFYTPYAHRRELENNLHPSTRFYLTRGLKSITSPNRYFPTLF